MKKETKKILIKRLAKLFVSFILFGITIFVLYNELVITDNPVDAIYYIYIVMPIAAIILLHLIVSSCVAFSVLFKNKETIEKYSDVRKLYEKPHKTITTIKNVLCIALTCLVMVGVAFSLLNNNQKELLPDKPISELSNSEAELSSFMTYQDGFSWFNHGCLRDMEKYNYKGSYAHRTITFLKDVPSWYLKKYIDKETHYISVGTRFRNHSTDLKTIEKKGVNIFCTIDDDLTNMEIIAFNRHSCVQISVGGPQGSDFKVDENKAIEYAYGFFQ